MKSVLQTGIIIVTYLHNTYIKVVTRMFSPFLSSKHLTLLPFESFYGYSL